MQKPNDTLKQMMGSEKVAQKKRTEAMKSIEEQSSVVEGGLPDTQKAVSGISKRQSKRQIKNKTKFG